MLDILVGSFAGQVHIAPIHMRAEVGPADLSCFLGKGREMNVGLVDAQRGAGNDDHDQRTGKPPQRQPVSAAIAPGCGT